MATCGAGLDARKEPSSDDGWATMSGSLWRVLSSVRCRSGTHRLAQLAVDFHIHSVLPLGPVAGQGGLGGDLLHDHGEVDLREKTG